MDFFTQLFTQPLAVGFIVAVICIALIFLNVFVRTPSKRKELSAEDQAQTIYGMCHELIGYPTWGDFKMTKLVVEKSGDEITITLASGDIVFNATGAMYIRDVVGGRRIFASEVNAFHPGAWVQYLITEYEEIVRDRERTANEARSKKFAPIDDKELFGDKQ